MFQETQLNESKMQIEVCRSWIRRIVVSIAGLAFLLVLATGAGYAESNTENEEVSNASGQVKAALKKLQSGTGSVPADDWTAFALARGGQTLPPAYLSGLDQKLTTDGLRLATDYARAVLVVNAAGMDARKAGPGQLDLPGALAKNPSVAEEGAHAAAFALMALEASDYGSSPGDVWNRTALIRWLLEQRVPGGGWSHAPGSSDVEVTGIVLAALSPYMERSDVREAAESALTWLSSVQLDTGGFGWPETSERAAQVVIALASLGIDPDRDPRFVKNGKSVLARLLEFQLPDGTFMHRQGGSSDRLAAVHALLALTAADRYQDGLTGLYRGVRSGEPVKVAIYSLEGLLAQGTGYGRTALDAVVQVLQKKKLPYQTERDEGQGVVLTSIGDYPNRKSSSTNHWHFVISKGQKREWNVSGVSGLDLKDIREIVLYYGAPPALVHSVTWEPLVPREGLPVAVTVEMETFDPAGGNVKVVPAQGATVAMGGAEAHTDARGVAVLEGLKAGNAVLRVSGDGVPSGGVAGHAAFEQPLKVDTYIKQVTVRVEGDQELMAEGESAGGTALEALEHFLADRKISYTLKDAADGLEIAAIRDIAADRYRDGDGWRFAVFHQGRWLQPEEDLKNFLLDDGMELVFYYGSTTTRLSVSVIISPARPKAGEPVTVTVTYREWDEAKGKYGPARYLSGAQVSAAGIAAVTGAAGQAVLDGLPEGVHDIAITGYSENQAPTVLRTVRQLAVAGVYPDEDKISPWAKDWVHDARARGILLGDGDSLAGAFRPKAAVTRAEFIVSLVRGLGIEPAAGTIPFEDVEPNAWYAGEIAAAAKAGLIAGTAPGRFSPEAVLTREQAAMLLARALKLQASRGELPADGDLISAAARPAVMAVMEHGWMTAQEDGRFHPKQIVTREQAAVIAVRIMTREGTGRQSVSY